jgi:hypothetical protein
MVGLDANRPFATNYLQQAAHWIRKRQRFYVLPLNCFVKH